jgi:two-component system NtrC family sensor kinase
MGPTTPLIRKPSKMKPRGDLQALQKISSMVNRSLELASILTASLEELLSVLRLDGGAFRFNPTPDGTSPRAVYRGLSEEIVRFLEELQAEGNGIERQFTRNQPVMISPALKWKDAAAFSHALREEGFSFFALYPVQAGNKILGTLALGSRSAPDLNEAQQSIVSTLTEIVGTAVVNAQLREQSHKLSEDLIALQEVNKIISQSFDLEDIIRRIVVEGKRLVKTSQCHLFLLDDQRQHLVGSASTEAANLDIRKVEIRLSEPSLLISALLEKRVIALDDLPAERRSNRTQISALNWRAAIYAPLLTKEQAIGVLICSDDSRERSFTQEEILRAETLAHQAAIALENAHLFQVISRSQKEWETTFDAMKDCVSVHDTKGKVIRANVALAHRLKTIPQRVIGRHCSDIYYPADSGYGPCRHTSSLQSETLMIEEVEHSVLGGTFEISVSPWYDKDNRLVGSIHVAKDISNEKHLQQQLIQSEKLSAIGELISGIAHELNNPLTGVMGYSQLLQLRRDLDDRAKESLLKINNLALRCQKIVQNLLSFSRKQKPERTLSDLNDILERTVELRNYELQVNNIEIIRELDRSLPKTIADAHQLQQVFLNLITNAEQAMLDFRGSGRLVIRTSTDAPKQRLIIEIRDDCPGIPEAHLTKIFDPFFTTKEVGKGTGLGLSLSYGIIKEHGGNIYVRSRLGEGSTFTIELPIIAQLELEMSLAPELMPHALHFENLVRDKRILVVDDEKYILDFFVEVFQMYPLHVDTANNGAAAVVKLQSEDYDVIFTDFKMPQMGGRELYHWIKEHRPSLLSRIVFVTGDTISSETRSFFENGSNRYLAKPFKIEEVKEVIQQTLEGGVKR